MHNIDYGHLKYTISIMQDAILPTEKTSMLVGSMLSQFKYLYCIYEGECVACDNKSSCIIKKMMGDGFDIASPIALQSDLQPKFIVKCLDSRGKFKEGDVLNFEVILFGELLELYSQYIYVFDTIGQIGIGPERVKYQLHSISDMCGNIVFKDGYLLKDIETSNIHSYIESRIDDSNLNKLSFISHFYPHTNSEHYCFIDDKVLSNCLKIRLDSMNILEEEDKNLLNNMAQDQSTIAKLHTVVSKRKYYFKKENTHINIPTYSGFIYFNDSLEPYLEYFLACEKFCIGQNLNMGFGQYFMGG